MVDELKITSLSGRGTLFLRRGDRVSYWLDTVDWGQASGTHNTCRYMDQIGAGIVSTSLGTRALSLSGWVVETPAGTLRERCDFLNTFFSPTEDYRLETCGRAIAFRPDCSVIYSREYAHNNRHARRFLVQATCPFPLFSDAEETVVPFESTQKLFRFPTGFGRAAPLAFALHGSAYRVTVHNRGGFPAGFTASIAFSGPVTDPALTDLSTGEMLGVRRAFAHGEQLELCTVPGKKRLALRDAAGETHDLLKYRDVRTVWLQLAPGLTRLAVGCADETQRANMAVTLRFAPLYPEVE